MRPPRASRPHIKPPVPPGPPTRERRHPTTAPPPNARGVRMRACMGCANYCSAARRMAPAQVTWPKKPHAQRLARAPLPCLNSTTISRQPGRRRSFADTTHAGAQPQLYQHALRIPCSDFVSKVYCFALSVSSLLRVDLRRGTPLLFTTVNDTLNARSSVELNTTCSSELAGASSNVRFSGSSASRGSLHVCSHHCIHACCISWSQVHIRQV